MKQLLISIFLCASIVAMAQTKLYSPKDLEAWERIGKGNGFVTHSQFFMEEVEGSKGFMLLSPHKYEDVVFRYEVMTLNPTTVLVALLNVSDIGFSDELNLKENSDSFGFWTKEVEDYMFGFRVMAHNSTPFLRKHPVAKGGDAQLALAPKDVMQSGWYHTVECGKKGKRLWLKIDNKIIIDVMDEKPLAAGKLAIRVRGTASELGKCMIRKVEIKGTPVK